MPVIYSSAAAECWREVGNHPAYEVSDLGAIRSLDRAVFGRDGIAIRHHGTLLKPSPNENSYLVVWLNQRPYFVHRVVAFAFISNTEEKRIQVNHKNGVRTDNRVANLEWATNSENALHSFAELGRRGTWGGRYGSEHPKSKAIVRIRDGIEVRYESIQQARLEGFDSGSICATCKGRRESYRGFTWRYAT